MIKRVSLLLGSYAAAICLTSLIHEVGHVLAFYSIGITDVTVRINPLTESQVVPAVGIPPEHLLYMSLSGMVFQAIVCSAISIAAWRRRSRQLFPLLICGPMALMNIGGTSP